MRSPHRPGRCRAKRPSASSTSSSSRKTVVVKPGTKVTWTNDDSSIHDIKDTSPLDTPVARRMSKGDTFSITYAQPGTYSYVCGIHPYMIGSVEVVP